MMAQLQRWAAQRGYRVAWGPRKLVETVLRQIALRRDGLELDGRFYLSELEAPIREGGDDCGQTVVVVAKPRPAHMVSFEFEGRVLDAVLPPTYFRYRAVFEDVRVDLAANGLPGAHVEILAAPLKAIANGLGLVSYGRNNISFVPGLGSYFQLCGKRCCLWPAS